MENNVLENDNNLLIPEEDLSHGLLFSSEQLQPKVFLQLNEYRKENCFCDVTIQVEDETFHAHKVVLSSASPYFHAMFTQGMRERNAEVVQLHDINSATITLLLDFIYTSKILIIEDNVQQLLPAANMLQLTEVRDACCRFLFNQLDPCNALGILLFADTHNCPELVKTTEKYVLQNFVKISHKEEFLALTFERVKFLLVSDLLIVDDESFLYLALMNWIKHDLNSRKQHLYDLLSLVKLPLMGRDFLILSVEQEDLIKNNVQCKDLLIEAMKYHLMPEMRRYLQSGRTKKRKCEKTKQYLYALGGQSLFAIHSECERLDLELNTWQSVPSMLGRRARLGIGIVYDRLYIIGGYDGNQDLDTVEIFNTKTKKWVPGHPMGTSRSCLGVAVIHNLVYAIGGYDGSSCLDNVERYDPLSQQWTSVAKMNFKRRYLSVGVIDECIIAAGGYDGNQHLSSCEIYNPVSNSWTVKAAMKTQRSSAGGCIFNGLFYISGGTDGTIIVTSVERYNMDADEWTNIRTMLNVRMTHTLVALDNILLAIGGNDGTTSLNSVEEYDTTTDTWSSKMPMTTRRSHVAAIINV